ncbi:hypothetical protein ACH5RR_002958 [Cinchona calisaya]|uniref:Uncharacterized protein n=1 Tax=Cinchona calisaya TaxID=153742 RepID=A0ABD3ATG1_9GENT
MKNKKDTLKLLQMASVNPQAPLIHPVKLENPYTKDNVQNLKILKSILRPCIRILSKCHSEDEDEVEDEWYSENEDHIEDGDQAFKKFEVCFKIVDYVLQKVVQEVQPLTDF